MSLRTIRRTGSRPDSKGRAELLPLRNGVVSELHNGIGRRFWVLRSDRGDQLPVSEI